MIAIKDMEMPKNCVECDHLDLREALGCQLIYSGCANCGRHPDCPLVEIITCKDCKHNAYQIAKIRDSEPTRIYCRKHKIHPCIDGFCSDAERRE